MTTTISPGTRSKRSSSRRRRSSRRSRVRSAKAESPVSWRAVKLSESVSTQGMGRGYLASLKDLDRLLEGGAVLPLDVGLGGAAGRAEVDRVEAHLVVADAAAGVLPVGVAARGGDQALHEAVAAGGELPVAAVDTRVAAAHLHPEQCAQVLVRVDVPAAVEGGAEVEVRRVVEHGHAGDSVEEVLAERRLELGAQQWLPP